MTSNELYKCTKCGRKNIEVTEISSKDVLDPCSVCANLKFFTVNRKLKAINERGLWRSRSLGPDMTEQSSYLDDVKRNRRTISEHPESSLKVVDIDPILLKISHSSSNPRSRGGNDMKDKENENDEKPSGSPKPQDYQLNNVEETVTVQINLEIPKPDTLKKKNNEVEVFSAVNLSDEFITTTNANDKTNSTKSELDELISPSSPNAGCEPEDKQKAVGVTHSLKTKISEIEQKIVKVPTPTNKQAVPLLTAQNLQQLQRRYAVGAPLSDILDQSLSVQSFASTSLSSSPSQDDCSKRELSDDEVELDWRYEEKKNELFRLQEIRLRIDAQAGRAKNELLQLERLKRNMVDCELGEEQTLKAMQKNNRSRGGQCRDTMESPLDIETLKEESKKIIQPLEEEYTNLMQVIMESTVNNTNQQTVAQTVSDSHDNLTTISPSSTMGIERNIGDSCKELTSRTSENQLKSSYTYKRFLTFLKTQKRNDRNVKRMTVAKPTGTEHFEFSNSPKHSTLKSHKRKNHEAYARKIEKLRTPFLAQRATYQGSMRADNFVRNLMNQVQTVNLSNPSPPAQFVSIAGAKKAFETKERKGPACDLDIRRLPIFCPDAYCQAKSFMSDFNRHLLFDHHGCNMERIEVNQTKTFFLDPTLLELNMPKCHMLYLLKDKIVDPHSKVMSDLMPIMVMATRANLVQIYCPDLNVVSDQSLLTNPSSEVVLIWLTSFKPKNMNISGTICACPSTQMHSAELLFVLTSQVYDISHEHTIEKLGRSSATLTLSNSCFNEMTRNGNDMICIQVQMH